MTNKLETLLSSYAGVRPLYMCHIIAGFPSAKACEDAANGLLDAGADILEIQIPFSDPMADGPSIAVASRDALDAGASVKNSLALVKKMSKGDTPVMIMSYLNPIYRYGIAKFCKAAKIAGASGLIIPDAPFDSKEGKEIIAEAKKNELCIIPVISPGVLPERLSNLAQDASGFVYCTTRQGITGANSKFAQNLKSYMKIVREQMPLPLGLGFGIKTKADAKQAAQFAEIVIAGSVFVDAIRAAKKNSIRKAVKNRLDSIKI